MKKEIINLQAPGVGLSGEFKYKLWNADGSLAAESDWDDNLITDLGLNIYTTAPSTTASWHHYFFIGSSATSPSIADTSMGTLLGFTQTLQGSNIVVNGTAPDYEYSTTQTRRFGPGNGTGTVREFGIGENTNGSSLFCRFSVTPEIVKSASQTLDVSYRITLWPSLADINNNDISIGGELYDTATSWYQGDYPGGNIIGQYKATTTAQFWTTYDGVKADITQGAPSGDVGSGSGNSGINDTGGTGFRDCYHVWELNAGNTNTEFVRTATGRNVYLRPFNTQFTATTGPNIGSGIPKDATQQLTLNWKLTWGRH